MKGKAEELISVFDVTLQNSQRRGAELCSTATTYYRVEIIGFRSRMCRMKILLAGTFINVLDVAKSRSADM